MTIRAGAALAVASATALAFAGCAKAPDKVEATYVSPVLYQSLSCNQLAAEASRTSVAAATATGQQSRAATKDKVVMGVGVLIFWPTLFLLNGDDAQTAELARLKGEMDAIEQTSIAKKCGIQFEHAAPAPVTAGAKPAPAYPLAR